MSLNPGIMSSNRDDWETPQEFYDGLDARFGFTLNAAASSENAKCDRYWTKEDDALAQDWEGSVYCNPPYGRQVRAFVEKGYREAHRHGGPVVMLLAARTDTKVFHEYAMKAKEIMLVKGRIRFLCRDPETGEAAPWGPAPFPSMVVVFERGVHRPEVYSICSRTAKRL